MPTLSWRPVCSQVRSNNVEVGMAKPNSWKSSASEFEEMPEKPNGVGITRQCLKSFSALLQGFFECPHLPLDSTGNFCVMLNVRYSFCSVLHAASYRFCFSETLCLLHFVDLFRLCLLRNFSLSFDFYRGWVGYVVCFFFVCFEKRDTIRGLQRVTGFSMSFLCLT